MGSSVFAGKVASSWAKPASRVGFLHLFRAIQFKRTYLRESIQPPQPGLNKILHF